MQVISQGRQINHLLYSMTATQIAMEFLPHNVGKIFTFIYHLARSSGREKHDFRLMNDELFAACFINIFYRPILSFNFLR